MAKNKIKPYLGTFEKSDRLLLEPTPNGGWVVSVAATMQGVNVILGAFSSTNDMLEALECLKEDFNNEGS